jgi:glycosyltransferase involved in cell wall biosynthesis
MNQLSQQGPGPLVSIIIPCFNDGPYLTEALTSALDQTYRPLEVIIVDDGSTDTHTISLLASLRQTSTILINTSHVGPAAARNAGIRVAKGKYVLPLDADDKIHPRYVESAVAVLESQANVGIVYCQAEYFGAQNGKWELPPYSIERMVLDNIIFVTALFRRDDWETVGGFDESLTNGMEDYDFWLSMIEAGRDVVQLPEVLFYYRIKPRSRTTRFVSQAETMKETYQKIYRNHPKFYSQYRVIHATALRNALIDQTVWWRQYHRISENRFINHAVKIILSLLTRSDRT